MLYRHYLEDPTKTISKSTKNRRRRQQKQFYCSDDDVDRMWQVFNESRNDSSGSSATSTSPSNESSSSTSHDDIHSPAPANINQDFSPQQEANIINDFLRYTTSTDSSDDSDCLSDEDSFSNFSNNSNDRVFREWGDINGIDDTDDDTDFSKLKSAIENDDVINLQISVSKIDILLACLRYSRVYSICQSGVADLFKLINSILQTKILPETRYLTDKLFNSKKGIEYHATCPKCKRYVGEFGEKDRQVRCSVCNENISLKSSTYNNFFTIINVENDIATLISQNIDHYEDIVNKRIRNRETIQDFIDGIKYKELVNSLSPTERNNFVTATFNSDGAPVFESSKFSMWPIQLIINELPVMIRNSKPVTCGLWFGKDKPDMIIFLKPFVRLMNKFANDDIRLKINDNERIIKVYALCCCVDSVARAPMQGFVQFNGYFGCNWCLHPGVYIPGIRHGSIKYILLNEIPLQRTEAETFHHMQLSLTSPNPVFGVKSPSCLINLQKFNIISGFVPDSMHCISQGVAQQFLTYWIESSNMPYSLNKHDIAAIDNVINKIKAPNQITRLSRGISDRKWWKAREWENWILYYSIPVLLSFPHMAVFVEHWALLVEAFYILNQDKITRLQLNHADNLLKQFVFSTQVHYSESAMTYNIHQLLHLTQSVVDWGPLWAHSGYSFESNNGDLIRRIYSAKGVIHQLCRSLTMSQSELILREHIATKPPCSIHSFISYLDMKYFQKSVKFGYSRYFGPNYPTKENWIDRLRLSRSTRTYKKMVKDNCVYMCHKRQQLRSDNSHAIASDGRYLRLKAFIVDEVTLNEHALCNEIYVQNIYNTLPVKKITYISRDSIPVDTKSITKICVIVNSESYQYICAVPNLYHY